MLERDDNETDDWTVVKRRDTNGAQERQNTGSRDNLLGIRVRDPIELCNKFDVLFIYDVDVEDGGEQHDDTRDSATFGQMPTWREKTC